MVIWAYPHLLKISVTCLVVIVNGNVCRNSEIHKISENDWATCVSLLRKKHQLIFLNTRKFLNLKHKLIFISRNNK